MCKGACGTCRSGAMCSRANPVLLIKFSFVFLLFSLSNALVAIDIVVLCKVHGVNFVTAAWVKKIIFAFSLGKCYPIELRETDSHCFSDGSLLITAITGLYKSAQCV